MGIAVRPDVESGVANMLVSIPAPRVPSRKRSGGHDQGACSDPPGVAATHADRMPSRDFACDGYRGPMGEFHSHQSDRGLPCPVGVEALVSPCIGQLRCGQGGVRTKTVCLPYGAKPLFEQSFPSTRPSSHRFSSDNSLHEVHNNCPNGNVVHTEEDDKANWRTRRASKKTRSEEEGKQKIGLKSMVSPAHCGKWVGLDDGSESSKKMGKFDQQSISPPKT